MKLRLISITGWAALVAAMMAATGRAATFTVVDANFKRTDFDLLQISSTQVRGTSISGPVTYDLRDVVMLERDAHVEANDPTIRQLVLRDGQRFVGRATGFENDVVTWNCATMGGVQVPLAQIQEIIAVGADPALSQNADDKSQDLIWLANGDRLSGIVTSMDAKSVVCQGSDGQPLTVEWGSIRAVKLATAGSVVKAKANWRIGLTDGTVGDVEAIDMKDKIATLTRDGKAIKVNVEAVSSIENLAGRTKLLTRLPTLKQEYAPYFPRTTGHATIGVPAAVSVGPKLTRAFIAVRPYSRMTWAIDEGATTFRTRFAVAEAGSMANCQARVWLDDKLVMDRNNLTIEKDAASFETQVGQAKTLTLEVDFGENFDVQDQLYWIEPAFVGR